MKLALPLPFFRDLRHWDSVRGLALLSPTLIVMVALLAAPLALLVLYSLWRQIDLTLDTHLTFAEYANVFARERTRTLFFRSLGISALVTFVTVALAYPMAWFVAFRVTRRKFLWLVALTIPFWTSYLLRVFAWKVILGYNGVVNSALISLGLIKVPLEMLLYNPFAVILTLAHAWAPFAILPLYVSLDKIDRSLLDAAADLGDSSFARFCRITLPLSLPGILAACVIVFVPTTGDYVTPTLVGGPDGTMIANAIEVEFDRIGNWPMGAAIAVASIVFVGAITGAFALFARSLAARVR